MRDLIGFLLPDSLMAQADYIDGLLYLPAYELADYVLNLSLPLALLCITFGLLFGILLVMLVHSLYRRISKKRT